MRGVYLVDQMRRDYTCQFWSRKWWHKVWFFVFDSSLQNAWRLYTKDQEAWNEPLRGEKAFHFVVAMELIELDFPLSRTCFRYNARNIELHHSMRSEIGGLVVARESNSECAELVAHLGNQCGCAITLVFHRFILQRNGQCNSLIDCDTNVRVCLQWRGCLASG